MPVSTVRRLTDYRATFLDEDPMVYILAPSPERAVPAGDTRRGTAWIFRQHQDAADFAAWMRGRHGLESVPVAVRLRQLVATLGERDLTFVLDPRPTPGYGSPLSFKAPLAH